MATTLGCAKATEATTAPFAIPITAAFSPTARYASTTWYQDGRPSTEIWDLNTGRSVKRLDATIVWGAYSDVAWYYEGETLRDLWLGPGKEPPTDSQVRAEAASLRADPKVSSLSVAADLAVYLRGAGEGDQRTEQLIACPFSAKSCVQAPPAPCPQFMEGGVFPGGGAVPVAHLRCKVKAPDGVQVQDYFWPIGGALATFATSDIDEDVLLGAIDGEPAFVRHGGGGSVALQPIGGGAETPVNLLDDLGPSRLIRSAYRIVRGEPDLPTSTGTWRVIAGRDDMLLTLEQRGAGDTQNLCFVVERRGREVQRLSCRRSFSAETVVARGGDGRPITGHLYHPPGPASGLAVRFHGGPFSPLPAEAEADVVAWLQTGVAVLDVGYVGGADVSALTLPTPNSQLKVMVDEAVALEAAARRTRPSLPPSTYVAGVSFGGIPALAFARTRRGVRGVFLTSPLCSAQAQYRAWTASAWMPTYRRPFGDLLANGADAPHAATCADLMASGPPIFVTYNRSDPVIGSDGVADIESGLKADPDRARGAAGAARSHRIALDTIIPQARAARAWFDSPAAARP